jgi:hypothetical protein
MAVVKSFISPCPHVELPKRTSNRIDGRCHAAEAIAGRVPCLRVGRKLLFSLPAVERILAERAASNREGRHAG